MTRRTTLTRTVAVAAVLAAALVCAGSSQAAPGDGPSATVGAVSCTDEQGGFDVTLTAGDAPVYLEVYVSGTFVTDEIDEVRDLAPHDSAVIHISDLDDEDYYLTIGGTVGPESDDSSEVMLEDEKPFTVACDPAPVGPYTNPKVALADTTCAYQLGVSAANKPIGGNTADLQPVEFVITYTPSDNPGDGSEDPGDGTVDPGDDPTDEPTDGPTDDPGVDDGDDAPRKAALDPIVLDSFTLDLATPTYDKTFQPPDGEGFFGTLTVTANGAEIASSEVGGCVLAPTSGTATATGAGLPDTGA